MAWDDNFWTGMIGEEYHYHVPIHKSFVMDNKCFIIPYLFHSECRIRFDMFLQLEKKIVQSYYDNVLKTIQRYGAVDCESIDMPFPEIMVQSAHIENVYADGINQCFGLWNPPWAQDKEIKKIVQFYDLSVNKIWGCFRCNLRFPYVIKERKVILELECSSKKESVKEEVMLLW